MLRVHAAYCSGTSLQPRGSSSSQHHAVVVAHPQCTMATFTYRSVYRASPRIDRGGLHAFILVLGLDSRRYPHVHDDETNRHKQNFSPCCVSPLAAAVVAASVKIPQREKAAVRTCLVSSSFAYTTRHRCLSLLLLRC